MNAFRTAQFLALGYANFTKRGFLARSKHFTPDALTVDLSDKDYIVTGANSGIGREVAIELARRGGRVHMICRDQTRGEKAREEVMAVAPSPEDIHLWVCDLSDLSDVRRFAQEYDQGRSPSAKAAGANETRKLAKVDALINNAGAMFHDYIESKDGLEMNFALNVAGTYLLTELLLPTLERAEHPRVVTVASGGMLIAGREALAPETAQGPDLVKPASEPDKKTIDGQAQYARNKRCQVALTEHWADKYRDSGIFWSVMHPGWTTTPGLEAAMPEFHSTLKRFLRPLAQGADTIVWLTIADEALQHKQAEFFLDRSPVPKHLWLAGTEYSRSDRDKLVVFLDGLTLQKD